LQEIAKPEGSYYPPKVKSKENGLANSKQLVSTCATKYKTETIESQIFDRPEAQPGILTIEKKLFLFILLISKTIRNESRS